MTRMIPLTLATLLGLGALAGCGTPDSTHKDGVTNTATRAAADEVEALPSDGLAAPEGMTLDSESSGDGVTGGNAVGSASGGNAT